MTPTIGRIVIYTQPELETPYNGVRQHPAIITRVWSNTCVNLRVFADGMFTPIIVTSAEMTPMMNGGGWSWPERAETKELATEHGDRLVERVT